MPFTKQNVLFVESFGELEQLCNQIYHSHHGVTNYIDDMTARNPRGSICIPGWNDMLKRLKEVRHKRNQLSHGNIPFSLFCATDQDINFVRLFRQNILNRTDPLALLRKRLTKTNKRHAPSSTTKTYPAPSHVPVHQPSRRPISCLGVIALFSIVLAIFICFLM